MSGAGTGSVSVEMALIAVDGRVYAVEKKEEAVQLLHKNKEKFRADNLDIISGTAPEALERSAGSHSCLYRRFLWQFEREILQLL